MRSVPAGDATRATRVGRLTAAAFLLVPAAGYGAWAALSGPGGDPRPATIVCLLCAAAASERLSLRIDRRATYTALTPLIVLAALLGGPAVAGGCALAAQLARPAVPWPRRSIELGIASSQALAAGLLAAVSNGTPDRILLASALALLVSAALATGSRAVLLLARGARAKAGPLRRSLTLDLAECLVATPLVAVLAVAAGRSELLAVVAVASVLLTLGLFRHSRASSATALAHERAAARRDQLTGAPNRRGFEEALTMEHARVSRGDVPAGIYVVDIDRFKSVNDRFGHQAGDEVIITVVRRLREGLRACDVVARWGGEEITVLAPGIRDTYVLMRFGERIRTLVGTMPVATRSAVIPITVSVGGTLLDGSATPQLALQTADEALYDAKRTRDTTVVTSPPRLGLHLGERRRRAS